MDSNEIISKSEMHVLKKKSIVDVVDNIEGAVLKERYHVQRLIDKGSFGKVYKVVDSKNKTLPLAIKICSDHSKFGKEINIMKKIYKQTQKSPHKDKWSTPEVINLGMIIDSQQKLMSYMIMPRYGKNLESYFEYLECKFNKVSVLDLGMALVTMLESMHQAGFIFNDLKLDNLMVGFESKLPKHPKDGQNIFENCSIHLVDFGFSTPYLKKSTGQHVQQEQVDVFRGNILFGSANQLEFKKTSRRDDLISMCYLMSYMLNLGEIKGIDLRSKQTRSESFLSARKAKQNHVLGDVCYENSEFMEEFVYEIFKLEFDEKPDYHQLRNILESYIKDKNQFVQSSELQQNDVSDDPIINRFDYHVKVCKYKNLQNVKENHQEVLVSQTQPKQKENKTLIDQFKNMLNEKV